MLKCNANAKYSICCTECASLHAWQCNNTLTCQARKEFGDQSDAATFAVQVPAEGATTTNLQLLHFVIGATLDSHTAPGRHPGLLSLLLHVLQFLVSKRHLLLHAVVLSLQAATTMES
jgi:hypothetical protein